MISVIVPIYNAEKFLANCIESFLNQSFTDTEILLIDDGSTDGSGKICDGFGEKHKNIRVFHTANGGVSAARNLGIDEAQGSFITFADADDCVPQNYLSSLFDCMGDADIAVCDVALYDGDTEKRRFTCSDELLDSAKATEKLLCRKDINTGPYAKLFRASVIKKLRFPALKLYEDILFVLAAFDAANSVAFTAETEYSYITNGDSAMHTINADKCLDVVVATDKICEYISRVGGELTDSAFYTTVSHLMQYFIHNPKNDAEKCLDKAIITVFAKYRKLIRKCKAFHFKEKLIYLAASRNLRIKNGLGKLI